jgi:hypothetical protein
MFECVGGIVIAIVTIESESGFEQETISMSWRKFPMDLDG